MATGGGQDDWPLIGRDHQIARALTDLRAGRGTVFCGEAGVGKTAVANAVVARAETRGWSVRRITGTHAGRSIPLGAIAALLPAPDPTATDIGDGLRRAAVHLGRPADGRPVLLAVDDAHLLDDTSATVVHQVALRSETTMIATVRRGEPTPDAVTALWKDDHAKRVDLEPLSSELVDLVVDTVIDGPIDGPSAKLLWERSRGNPLYLRELLEGTRELGLLTMRDGVWTLDPRAVVNPRLVDLITTRIDALDAETRGALAAVAVAGELPIGLMQSVADSTSIAELERRGLVLVDQDDRRRTVRMGHPVHQDVIDHLTPETERLATLGALTDSLAETGARRRDDVMRLAIWATSSNRPVEAPVLTEAARQALEAHHHELAVSLARSALDLLDRSDSRLIMGRGLAQLGRIHEAEDLLGGADLADASDRHRVDIAVTRADNLFWAIGDTTAATEVITEARQTVTDAAADAELATNGSVYAFMSGRPDIAIDTLHPVVDAAPARVQVTAAMSLAPALAVTGRTDDAVVVVERALEARRAFPASARLTDEPMLYMSLAHTHVAGGDLVAGGRAADLGYRRAVDGGDIHGQAWCSMMAATVAAAAGDLDRAARFYGEAEHLYATVGMPSLQRACAAGAAGAHAVLGHEERRDEAARRFEGLDGHRYPTLDPDVLRAMAEVCMGRNDRDGATDLLLEAVDRARAMGARQLEARALHEFVRLGDARLVADDLTACTEEQQSAFTGVLAAHGRAAAADDGEALEAAATTLEGLGALLLAAEAWAQAAASQRRASAERVARRCARQANALAARCGGVRTPALAEGGEAGRLTKREREVAEHSARGLSNKQVAEALHLSVRTVESHLHRIYGKLGVDRDGLADALDG